MNRVDLNAWVNEQLRTRNISMSKLESLAGIPKGYVSKVLSDKRQGGLDFYVKIAQAFDAVPEMLGVAGIVGGPDLEEMSDWEIFKAIRRMTPEQRREVETFVDYVVSKPQPSEEPKATNQANLATGDALS